MFANKFTNRILINNADIIYQLRKYTNENKKLVSGFDYFKNIAHNVNTIENYSECKQLVETKLKKDSEDFSKKILQNPNRFIENRRPKKIESFIEKDSQNFKLELKNEPPVEWKQEISDIQKYKKDKSEFFKSTFDKSLVRDETSLQKDPKFDRKFIKKIELAERKESFKEKFIDFQKKDLNEELNDNTSQIENTKSFRPVAYNLAYFSNDSIVLKKFIEMGVMIRKWDKDRDICEFILKLDLDRDIKPHLIFLHDIKIPHKMHATVIEKNPMLFKESLDSLNIRIDYLKSKKFTEEAIAEMVIKAPRILGLNVEKLDSKLGWFQNEFDLTASELRQIVHSRPKLITLPLKIISDVRFCLKEFLSFSDSTIKSFIKTYPKLFTKDFKIIEANYNYITKVMKLSDQQIINYPPILQAPLLLIKTRYAFLKHLDRLQFDPTLSNYIPVKSIIEPIETKFVEKYAKSNIIEYKKFLKSI